MRRNTETFLKLMEEGYFEVDLAGNFTFVNDAELRNLGYTREEIDRNEQPAVYAIKRPQRDCFKFLIKSLKQGNRLRNLIWKLSEKTGLKGSTKFRYLL